MFLVDTSVWVDFLRGGDTTRARILKALLDDEAVVGIAQIAIEHSLILLHHDKDFDAIASVEAALRLYA